MKYILLLLLSLNVARTFAQVNLVPNPGFESYIHCPSWSAQIDSSFPWFQPNIFGSSTDYFNSCSINPQISVPNNYFGNQTAKSGSAYAGFVLYCNLTLGYREYLEVMLTDSLIQGETYCVMFHIVSAKTNSKYGIDAIGAYLSVDSVLYNDPIASIPYLLFFFAETI